MLSSFIHADYFLGNILQTPENDWYCIDFDECGFGNIYYDLGTIRTHMLKFDNHKEFYQHFLQGYEIDFSYKLNLGTAMRLYFMMGKITQRLDVAFLKNDPASFIKRYINYFEYLLN